MKRKLLTLAGTVLALAAGTGTAAASSDSALVDTQAIGQAATSWQQANASADSTQIEPTNVNVPVRIFSPGDGGDVAQSNSSRAAALAANLNGTDQDATQSQPADDYATQAQPANGYAAEAPAEDGYAAEAPAPDSSGSQAVGQVAESAQNADASADSTQIKPTNVNVPVRIFSPGDDGDVTQSNDSTAAAASLNLNGTDQTASQSQDSSGSQAVGQVAESAQDADASADSTQIKPTNVNVPVRIFSPGDGGDVTQSNDSSAKALAANANHTDQEASQSQGGGGYGTQAIGQAAKSGQKADASANSTQKGATNINVPVRIFSPGDGGDVTQSNSSAAGAAALNLNGTDQTATQSQDGAGYGTQAIGQAALNVQGSKADANSTQIEPTNANVPARILSPGDDGDVTQSNDSSAKAIAANLNATEQDASQSAGGKTPVTVQAIGQLAGSLQLADSTAESKQIHPSNANAPVGIFSSADGGSVHQSNNSDALAAAVNKNATSQKADQALGSEHGLLGVQAVGQLAASAQGANAHGDSVQVHPTNANTPVEIDGKDHGKGEKSDNDARPSDYDMEDQKRGEPRDYDKEPEEKESRSGAVWQANESAAWVLGLNFNATSQGVRQTL
jgi:hypothetical protein